MNKILILLLLCIPAFTMRAMQTEQDKGLIDIDESGALWLTSPLDDEINSLSFPTQSITLFSGLEGSGEEFLLNQIIRLFGDLKSFSRTIRFLARNVQFPEITVPEDIASFIKNPECIEFATSLSNDKALFDFVWERVIAARTAALEAISNDDKKKRISYEEHVRKIRGELISWGEDAIILNLSTEPEFPSYEPNYKKQRFDFDNTEDLPYI